VFGRIDVRRPQVRHQQLIAAEHVQGQGLLLKTDNWRLRTALVEAAWRWVNKDPAAKATFGRLVRNTGDVKKAIVGMARRLAITPVHTARPTCGIRPA